VKPESSQPIPSSLAPLLDLRIQAEKEKLRNIRAEITRNEELAKLHEQRIKQYEETLKMELANGPEISLDGVTDRWEAFKLFSEAHRYDGFTRPQLQRFLANNGIRCGNNFPYEAVKALGERLIQNGDRFFLRDVEIASAQRPESHPRPIGELIGAVRRVIQTLDRIDSGTVYRTLRKERFEFWAQKPTSSIANIIRKLAERGELEKISEADELHPAYYRKVVNAESSERNKRNVKMMRPAS
jgi:hypothetical protein